MSAFSLAVALVFGGFGAVPGLSSKAEAAGFPEKPVQLIVPYRAGGGTDTMARVFAKALSAALGQPVPVVNHKGGGGAVGGSRLKNSAPDGHTILMGGDDIASYIPLVSEVDFAYEDFRFLAAVAEYQNAMYAKKGAPFTTFEELADRTRRATRASVWPTSAGSRSRSSTISSSKAASRPRSSPPAAGSEIVQLLLGGQIDAAYSGGIHNKNPEQWEVLGSFNANRLPSSPDKPTFKEAGYGMAMPAYVMVMTPAGVPDDVAATLEAALLEASK